MTETPLIVALDYADPSAAKALSQQLDPRLTRVKVGKELFTRGGPAIVEALMTLGFDVFLDLKFHDIPHTVAGACRAAAGLGVWMVDVHASGGQAMLAAARAAIDEAEGAARSPLLIAVTLLTSLKAEELPALGLAPDAPAQALRLAALAQEAGVDGLVCSPQEVAALRQRWGEGLTLVTPGIRPHPEGVVGDDQSRTTTPEAALAAGANYLVIGRPITQASDPLKALEAIYRCCHGHGTL